MNPTEDIVGRFILVKEQRFSGTTSQTHTRLFHVTAPGPSPLVLIGHFVANTSYGKAQQDIARDDVERYATDWEVEMAQDIGRRIK